MIIISLDTCCYCYVSYFHLKYYFCAMLGLYGFKQFVGENETDYHLSAKSTELVDTVF